MGIADAQLIAVPAAASGERFAVAGQLRQYAAALADNDSAARFALKGAVVAPGACAEEVFRDGYE